MTAGTTPEGPAGRPGSLGHRSSQESRADGPLSVGIDIGGTKVAAGVVDDQGAILERLQVPTPSHSPRAVEDAIVDLVTRLRSGHAGVESVGIGAAGWVDNTQSIVRFSPHLAWREEPLRDRLRALEKRAAGQAPA